MLMPITLKKPSRFASLIREFQRTHEAKPLTAEKPVELEQYKDPANWTHPKPNELAQALLVKAAWVAMADIGACDSYGGSEYLRCKPIVVEFVQRIFDECNSRPV
jgi:hypothetical protein